MVTGEGVGERGIIAAETSTGEAHMEEKALQLLDNLFGTDLCLPFLSGVPWKWGCAHVAMPPAETAGFSRRVSVAQRQRHRL